MKRFLYIVIKLGLLILMLLTFPKLILADFYNDLRYSLDDDTREISKLIAETHLGKELSIFDSFLYYDYLDRPSTIVVTFNRQDSTSIVGSLYFSLNNLIPIEIIRGNPLHVYPFENLKGWLDNYLLEVETLDVLRVYYHPFSYPLLKIRVAYKDGSVKTLLVDPELKKIISEGVLNELAEGFCLLQSFSDVNKLSFRNKVPPLDLTADDWTIKQLPVHEINTVVTDKAYGSGPDAAANVLVYWVNKGNNFFPESDNTANPEITDVDLLLSSLYIDMETSETGNTKPLNIKTGIEKTLDKYNINGSVGAEIFFSFEEIKKEINEDRPCIIGNALFPSSLFYKHYMCVIGYKESKAFFSSKYLIVHDGFESTPEPREQLFHFFPSSNIIFGPNFFCKIALEDCYAMDYIQVLPGEAEYIGYVCAADVYLKNSGSESVSVYYHVVDTDHDSDFWKSIKVDPGEELQVLDDGGWVIDMRNNLFRFWTEVTAIYNNEECMWIGNDIPKSGIRILNVEDMNPCQ